MTMFHDFGGKSGRRAPALIAVLFATTLAPTASYACACGCGIFDVGANVLAGMPSASGSGFSVWFRYSYMNQNQNWEGTSKAPASDNSDKDINTSFYTVGGEYMINSDWTVMAELPVYARHLRTTDDGTVFGTAGSIYTGKLTDLGDLQLSASYTGLSPDMSTGLSFGVKLPTGNYTGPTGPLGGAEFDRDSLPGTGSTDLMVGAYHVGTLTSDGALGYFGQVRYQFAVLTRDSYRPGNELDGAVGLTYDFGAAGTAGRCDAASAAARLLSRERQRQQCRPVELGLPAVAGRARRRNASEEFPLLRRHRKADLPGHQRGLERGD